MKKPILSRCLLVIVILMAWIGPAWAGIGDKLFFSKYPTTVEDLVERWGKPVAQYSSQDGYDFFVFGYGYQGGIWENRYFVAKDNRVIDGGFNYGPFTMEEWPRP